jgi:CheY-like chemotaxis protein
LESAAAHLHLVDHEPTGIRILVVDDDAALRWTLAAFLQTEGYRVQTAANGESALEYVERERPTVILLDMDMPVLDGESFVQEMRAREINVPIIAMTAAKDARRWAEQIGATAYVVKPVSFPALLGRIDQAIVSA